jgi:hypothetical protein
MGELGRKCHNRCRENDPLASEEDGSPETNVESTSSSFCTYKAIVMPDGVTVLSGAWYENAIVEGDVSGDAIERRELLSTSPKFDLRMGCIHHRTVMSLAESANIEFPPGNEIVDESDAVADAMK